MIRNWEYKVGGDYHRNLNPNWSYAPTYYKKMKYARDWIDSLDSGSKILDVGCGEGLLVEEYISQGFNIWGLDRNFGSHYVTPGDILSLPFPNSYFDAVLLLDVFEHLDFRDQPNALKEVRRVLGPQGMLLASIPNLAHLNSRFRMFFSGELDRTDIEDNHPGERPFNENLRMLNENGYKVISATGITLTVPIIYRRLICRHAKRMRWLHDLLDIFSSPPIAMVSVFSCVRTNY